MRIAITGASGLIGSAVTRQLESDGHTITRLVRTREAAARPDAVYWSPSRDEIDAEGLADHDVVINLAGENILGVWTEAKRRRIRESRVGGTRLLVRTIMHLPERRRPELLVNASAIGYYGDRPSDEPLTEDAEPGDTFMAGVVQDWETAAAPAAEVGLRVAMLRFGLVLSTRGLLLQGMTTATRLGLGATLGDGHQVFPWSTRDEIAGAIRHTLATPELHGPVNVVGPEKVTNEEFADTLARILGRPRFLKIPAFAIEMLGDLGGELLNGAWVVPGKLQDSNYDWVDATLEGALRRLLARASH